MKPLTARQVEKALKEAGFLVPHHGNRPLPQGTLLLIFRQVGIAPPQ